MGVAEVVSASDGGIVTVVDGSVNSRWPHILSKFARPFRIQNSNNSICTFYRPETFQYALQSETSLMSG
jgi:hypothetical protein